MEERRKHKRLKRKFIVSFRPYGKNTAFDVSQMKDISVGGVRFMTSKPYAEGTTLILQFKTPISAFKFEVTGNVIESKKVVENLIYDTHVSFMDVDKDSAKVIKETVDYFSKNI